jgi:hypothetical protein
MATESSHQQLIISHAVLIGLTPLIPLPILDDIAKSYFQRRLARKLSADFQIELSNSDLITLANDRRGGCLQGCLGLILIYPIRKLFRKIFYFLEWKRAIDLVSRTYHQFYLLEQAFQQNLCAPMGEYSAAELRAAIDATCKETGTNPIEGAVKISFQQSKDALKSGAQLLKKILTGAPGRPDEASVEQAAQAVMAEEERSGVTGRLLQAVDNIPPSYFQRLRERMALHLRMAREKSPSMSTKRW